MKSISLLPPEIKESHRKRKQVMAGILFGFVVLLAFSGVYAFLSFSISSVDAELDKITSERDLVQKHISELKPYRELETKVIEYEQVLEASMGNVPDWGLALASVARSTSNEVWLTELYLSNDHENSENEENNDQDEEDVGKGELSMYGYAINHGKLASCVNELERMPTLQSVELSYSNRTTIDDRQVVEFFLTAEILTEEYSNPLKREGIEE